MSNHILLISVSCYLFIINSVALLSMVIDKRRARRNEWRIKERTLFTLAIIGGSIGSFFGMIIYHHKTKHLSFMLGIPFIFILQAIITISILSIF